MEELNTKFQSITQNLYNNTNDEVTDNDYSNVDYEEVK